MTVSRHAVSAPASTGRLRAVVLLAGGVGRSVFRTGIRRSALDLPISDRHRIMDLWLVQLRELVESEQNEDLVVRIAVDPSPKPSTTRARGSTSGATSTVS